MKRFFTKVAFTVTVIVLFLALAPASAQYTKTQLHTGGLYTALAKDASGNVYVTKASGPGVYHVAKYTGGTGSPTIIYSGLTSQPQELPWGLAVAPNGDVYISTDFTSNSGAIIRLNAASAYAATTVQTGRYFTGLTFDAVGNLYALEYNVTNTDYAVCKYAAPATLNSPKTMLYHGLVSAAGVSYPTGITIATNGDIYVTKPFSNNGSNTYTGGIAKLTAPGYTATDVVTGTYTTALVLDEFGNLYASENAGTGVKLYKYTGATGAGTVFYSPLNASDPFYPYGVTFIGTTGYIADGDNGSGGELIKLTPTDVTLPTAPTGLAASAGSSQNILTWNTNADVDLLGYKVYGGTTAAPTTLLAAIPKGTTTYTHTGIINGTPYFYRISATDNYFNESAKTADVTATPTPPAITSATYNASTGALVVTGTAFPALAGATNDIVTNKFAITGESGAIYTLTSANVEITSSTAFTINLNATDKNAVGMMLNKNGASSTSGTTYNLAAAEDWAAGENVASVIVDATNPVTVSNVVAPAITSATYNASTGALVVTGTNFLSLSGATNDIVANKFTLTGEGGATYTLTNTGNVEITSGTAFTLTLSVADQIAVNQIINKNGTSSTSATTYNLAAAEDWAAGADAVVVVADLTGNGITASNVAVPAITSATYDAATGLVTVTGSGFLSKTGAANDIVANKFTITGEGGVTYTLTDTPNPEISSATAFTLTLSVTDQAAINQIINKNGTSSTGGTTYNLAAAEDWAAGADAAVVVADLTGNGITTSNVAIPTLASATYNVTTGVLTVTGTGFLRLNGATNDIVANKFTLTGDGGATYTLTTTPNIEITSATTFSLILSTADKAAVNLIANKNGTSSTGGTTYNLAGAEDWAAGADAAVVVADLTGNGITVSNVAVPTIASATYNASTGALVVTGTNFLSLSGATNDIVANKFTLTGEGGATYTLTNTGNVEITSATAFTLTLSAADQAAVNQIINKNGTSSTGATTYNLAAAEDWAAGADAAVVVADLTGNGITASNVAIPAIASATYDASTGTLVVTGTNFLSLSGAANDIVANKLTFKGQGAGTYTLTDSPNAEITSGTSFSITVSATDKAGLATLMNKDGLAALDATVYNLAAAEDWNAGAAAAVTIADATNPVTVSGVKSTNADLASLTTSAGTFIPSFAAGTTSYSINVPYTTTTATVTATRAESHATLTSSLGAGAFTALTDGIASSAYTLNDGANLINVRVTAEETTVNKTYILTVNKQEAASIGDFVWLDYNQNGLQDAGEPGVAGATVTLTGTDIFANTINLTTTTNASGNYTFSNLNPSSAYKVVVSGYPARYTTTYDLDGTGTIGATFALASGQNRTDVDFGLYDPYYANADLTALSTTAGLTPVFAAATTTYTASALTATNSVKLTATALAAGSTLQINANGAGYVTLTSGVETADLALNFGNNTFDIKVTAQNGTTTKTYTITVNRSNASQSITFASTASTTYGSADFDPGATSATSAINAITYSSDNLAVATIVAGKIHVVAAGSAVITAKQAASTGYNAATDVTQTLTVNAKSLTGNFTAGNKVYNGNNTANVLTRTLNGVVTGDELAVTLTGGTATFDDANVANGKTVTSTGMTLGGAKAANYTLSSVNTTTANITAKDISGNFTAGNKVYDGNNTANILTRTLSGVVTGEETDVTLTGGTATFNNENAGTGKTVTATGLSLTGTKAANYNLTGVGTATADITGLALTGAFTASNKVYDGNTTASVLTRTLTGVLAADAADVILTGGTAAFANASVGTGKTVTAAGMTLGGAKASNYSLSSVATTTANITGLALTGNFTVDNKVYDGNNSATILTRTLTGVLAADIADVTLTGGTATFGGINTGPGKTITSTGMVLSGTKAGNYTLFAVNTTTADITPKDISGNFTASNKAYDGNAAATVLTRTLTGVVAADLADVSLTGGTATFANANIGTGKTVTATGMTISGTKADNYTLTGVATTTANITGLALTGNFTAGNKVYDGNATATVLTRTLTGVLAADAADVTLTGGLASFADANKGTGKTVTATGMTITGTKAANYTLASVTTTTADITAKDLTAGFTADNKIYDGNATANILTRTLTGVLAGDVADVTVSGGTATFNNENVGIGKSVNASGLVLAGAKAANYNIISVNATTANITGKNISGNFTADNKVYDGNTTAGILSRTLTGVLAADAADVNLTGGTASFATESAGTGKTVTATGMTITGTKAANYSLTGVATTTANITGLAITGSITASNKVYNGNNIATISGRTLTGVLTADVADVTLTGGTATFANANKGTGKTVTATGLTLAGAKAANYTLASVTTTTADITAKDISGSFTADNKVYDGNANASILTRTLAGVLVGDVADVNLTGGTASFDNANMGTGKTVTANGMSLAGTKAGNYNLTGVATTTANITGLTLTGNFTAGNKVYDGNATATVLTRTLTGVLAADAADVTLTGGTASFANANVGTGKTVTATGMTITGTKAANYTLASVATTTADISTKDINGNFTADNKIYDGSVTANILTRTLTGVLAGDVADVNLTGGTASFANANVGTAKTVSAAGLSLTGSKSANYNLTGVATTTANITTKNITGTFTADNKAYDGNTTATILTRTLTGVITADVADVTLTGGTANFADANIGTGKTVTSAGMTLAGSKSANYNLTGVATTTANIGVRNITGSFTASNKVYDGNTTATVLTRTLTGVLTADADVNLSGGTASFADASAATGKTVTAAGMVLAGTNAANYNLTSVTTTTAAITAKAVNGNITASNKVYDGNTTATISGRSLTGVLAADVADVTLTGGTATFADKNVGTAKVVTGAGLLLSGTKAANYTLTSVATTTANISVKPIVVTADAKTKVYGSADAALTYTLSTGALVTGDVITGSLSRAAGENIGNYAIGQNTISAGTNYIITYTPADLVITRKALVIIADNKNKNFGDANPALTASYNGFAGTETAAVLTSAVALSTTATTTSPAGNYPITASGAAAANYSITYIAGNLTVNPSTQTITFAALANKLDTDGIFTLTATASSGLTVTYTSSNPAVARIINGNQVEILKAGVINITASQAGNSDYQAAVNVVQSFTVIENPPPVITITSNKGNSISKGETATLTASGGLTYQWTNANGIISGQNTAILTVRPSQNTTYTVTGFNQYGRSSTKTFNLEVRADYQVLNIMNVLTPNGDGKNDTWFVENIDMYPNNTVRVFDRAGKSIFEMKGYDNSWGGTLKGSLVPEGAYYYIIDFGPGIGVRKGYITVVGNN
ncbi:gliding motility-associated-like protein [Pedobacter sp. W3I1]|uniref:YDG domain-containing protein n=1 Tax=Pedobacter sp. W3I1 TaxID=3042291 RepID=UPI0027802DAC|nr:YDG domain-containing protein [Pedobacter sp. W3I1]MDQ0639576.1 gliding motility-associated-like protein [Pedobacter sp. W3I1]